MTLPDGSVCRWQVTLTSTEADAAVFAAMVFVRDAAGSLALVFSPLRGEWGPPGGRVEPGESVRDCAVRELREETGLSVAGSDLTPLGYETFSAVPGRRAPAYQGSLQMYAVTLPVVRPPLAVGSGDAVEPSWLDWAETRRRCEAVFWWPVAAELRAAGVL